MTMFCDENSTDRRCSLPTTSLSLGHFRFPSISIPTLIPSQEETVFSFLCPFYLNFHIVNQECSHDRIQVNSIVIVLHECS